MRLVITSVLVLGVFGSLGGCEHGRYYGHGYGGYYRPDGRERHERGDRDRHEEHEEHEGHGHF